MRKKDSVVNLAFGLSNSNKAYTGRLDGMNDPYLMKKKEIKATGRKERPSGAKNEATLLIGADSPPTAEKKGKVWH